MGKRILSGIVGGALFVGLGLLGRIWLALGLGGLLILGTYELWHLCRANSLRFRLELPAAIGLGLILVVTTLTLRASSRGQVHAGELALGAALAMLILTASLAEVVRGEIRGAATTMALTLLAGVYVSFPLAYMILLRGLPGTDGLFYFFLLTVVTWVDDSTAYFVGTAFGRHRLAPSISPNKSIEGSAAGLIASILSGLVYALCWGRSPWVPMGLGLLIGLLGQIGDLFESLLKRDLGVKDSGAFLPGHGGVLDRFDSLFFAVPALYYLVAYLIH